MDYLGPDYFPTSEYDSMSVDAILAEFKAQSAADGASRAPSASAAGKRSAQAKKSRGEHLSMPSKHRDKHEKQRRSTQKKARAEREASAYIDEENEHTVEAAPEIPAPEALPSRKGDAARAEAIPKTSAPQREEPKDEMPVSAYAAPIRETSAPLREEPEAEKTLPAPETPVREKRAPAPAVPRSEPHRPSVYADTGRRSARPSDAEVREFLDAFKRGDFLNLAEAEVSNPPVQPDERFYMGGSRVSTMQYDGKEVDMSPDESYRAPQSESSVYSYAREEDGEPEDETERSGGRLADLGAKVAGAIRGPQRGAKAARAPRHEKRAAEPAADPVTFESLEPSGEKVRDEEHFESAFSDYQQGDYAVKREFETAPPDYDEIFDEAANPGSFREYVFSRLTALLYGLRRSGGGSRTMVDDDEDLGHELNCAKASKYYGSYIRSMRLRLRISGILLIVMLWLSIGLPVPGMLKTSAVANALCLGLQLGIMLLCLDVVTTGVMNAFRGKFGADSMAVLACVLTSIDAILAAKTDFVTPHLALCLISSLSLAGEMFAAVLHARAMRKALRVPAIGRRCFAVTGENDSETGDLTILKSVRPPLGFVRRSEQSSPDEDLFRKISLPLLILAFVFALTIAFVKKDLADFAYIFSVVFCPAVPFAAMCCYSLPFFLGSMRIFPSGAAIAGWSGMSDIGQSKNLIVTDRDLFPDGTVEIGTIRVFADEDPARIISYAGSMMAAAGSCSAPAFGALMERNGCRTRNIENFEYLAGGGMKGIIDSRVILCGSTDLMRLMNVRIPFRLVDKTSVLLSVDGILCGIFNMKYTAKPQVREALIDLMRSNRHPVFAIRDFNVTPEMLHVAFDVATDGYDFPPYVDRFDMSSAEPGEDSQIAAIICREGLGPLVHTADTARSIYSATRINTLLAALSALFGLLFAAFRLLGAGSVSIPLLFAVMLFFALVTAAVSFFTRL
ncbi:MAG: hypothetical protein IJQ43_03050 [Oscillospiraceae bacterium]|nr:hypothetical protein [Oscillospiraceae bacterium]